MDSKSSSRSGLSLFSPAIWLMNQLRFPQKFALITLLFLLPLGFVMVLFLWQTTSNIDLVRRERMGTTYLRVVRNLYQDALQNQIEAAYFQSGSVSDAEITRLRAEIARELQQLERANEQATGTLETTRAFQTLKTDWQKLQAQPLDQPYDNGRDLNAQLVVDIRSLITEVGNSSTLFLDPRLDSRYLIDVLVLKLPVVQSLQADTLTLDLSSMAQQSSTAGLARTSTQMALLQSNLDDIQSGMRSVFENTATQTVQPVLSAPLELSVDTTTEFINAVGRAWNAPVGTAQLAGYWQAGSAAVQASFEFWDKGMGELDRVLQARSDGLNQQRFLALGIAGAVLLLVAYLWVGFYRAVMRTVSGMEIASQRMVSGHLGGTLELDNRDELGQIVAAFNRIASALVSSSAYRQAVVDNAADGIFTVDDQGVLLSFNPAAERIFGFLAEQAIGSNATLLLAAENDASANEIFAHLSGSHREVKGQRQDGTSFPLDLAVSETRVGEQRFLIGIARDITELKQAQIAVRESEQRLADILNFLPDTVLVIDQEGKVIVWNRAMEEMTGTKAEAILGKGNHEYALPFYGERRPILIDLVTLPQPELEKKYSQIKRVGQVLIGETYVPHLKGSEVYLLGTASALHDSQGNVVGAIEVIRDFTERKRMEEALQQAKEAAEAATQAKSAFLATMSHEIRTPMNAVIGMTGLLLDTPLTSEQREFAETIRTSGDSLLTIINDILDFSKIEAGRMELESIPFDLGGCLEGAIDLLASRAREKGLDLAYVMEDGVPPAIVGDVTRLRQVLVNLVGNALKFTEQGEIVVTVKSDKRPVTGEGDQETVSPSVSPGTHHLLHFSVRDTGLGIPPERQSQLFQSFSQVDASTTRRFGGTGLGLAISRRLTELMGGTMWVESEGVPGKGSTFHFTIQAQATEQVTPRPYLRDVQPRLEGKHVLIVDDNATNRHILSLQTRAWGMQPTDTASPHEALEWIRRGDPFDVALLDFQMPEMDGMMLAGKIRRVRSTEGPPIVILSSLGQREARVDDVDLAAYLMKPIKASQLYNALVGIFGTGENLGALEETKSVFDTEMGKRHPLSILLAEDNATNQKLALLVLARLGYRADVAANGVEVLQALQRQPYDVVLMDMQMPEMDGLEATRTIIREFSAARRPRIVAMTANAMKEDRDECFAAGMDDFLTKPIQVDDLVTALNKCQAREGAVVKEQPAPAAVVKEQSVPAAAANLKVRKKTTAVVEVDSAPPVLDQPALQRLRNNLGKQADAMLPGLIEGFFKDAPRLIADARRALEQNEVGELRRAAHTLKSTSATFGALALAALARELEYKARENALEGADKLLTQIQTEFTRAQTALQALRK